MSSRTKWSLGSDCCPRIFSDFLLFRSICQSRRQRLSLVIFFIRLFPRTHDLKPSGNTNIFTTSLIVLSDRLQTYDENNALMTQ